ncbi:hypothetical protein ACFWC9_37180 [Streptomyces goshikiensis]
MPRRCTLATNAQVNRRCAAMLGTVIREWDEQHGAIGSPETAA